jgi:hypothetical protein
MHTTPRHSTQAKEREDAARFAKVMEEATKEVLEREQLEHELLWHSSLLLQSQTLKIISAMLIWF